MRFHIPVATVWIFWAGSAPIAAANADGLSARVDGIDGVAQVVEGLSFEAGWKLRGTVKGMPFAMSAQDVVGIHFSDRKAPPRPRGYKLLLDDGGWLGAGFFTLKDDVFKLRSDSLGEMQAPLANVRAVVLDAEATNEQIESLLALVGDKDAKSDRVVYRNGDLALGALLSIDEQGVVFERASDRNKLTVGRELVLGVAFDPSLAGKTERPGLFGQLRLADGNALCALSIVGKGETLAVRTPLGATLKIAASDLIDLKIRGGGIAYLSDLKPLEARAESYLGLAIRPYETDRSAQGGDLTLQGRSFAKGLGTRSASRIVYDVSSYRRFEAVVGLDDAAGDLASVRFLVLLDGKAVFDSGEMAADSDPMQVRIDLAAKKRLELVVDFARRADAEDFANWCDARLIK